MSRYILHLITSYVSNHYMYNQIVGVKGYKPVVHGGLVLEHLPFDRFFPRSNENNPEADFRKIISKYPIEIIHGHFGSLGAKAVPFAKEYDLPLVTHFRGGDGSNHPDIKEKWLRKYERLITDGSLFLPVCKALVPMLIDLGFPPERIKVLYGGINLDDFPYVERDFHEPRKICFVGKTSPKKGLPTLLQAFSRLTRHFSNLQLRIISSAPSSTVDREEYQLLQRLIDDYGIETQVSFRFNVNNKELYKELHDSHLFCHPSVTHKGNIEGIPNALKEAMATGLPSVSTFHAGIPELIENEHCGLLVPENDALALSDALGRLLSNPSLCQQFSNQGRKKVEEHFELSKQLKRQRQLYDSAIRCGEVI